jgi:hypothetical protein
LEGRKRLRGGKQKCKGDWIEEATIQGTEKENGDSKVLALYT